MNEQSRKTVCAMAAIAAAVVLAISMSAPSAGAQAPGQKIEEAFKNIQALKGESADMLLPTMVYFEAALGVGCPFCHDPDGNKREVDTDRKRTARRMIQMVRAANETTFSGAKVVTCMTCHQGRNKPIGVPFVATDQAPPALGEAYVDAMPKPSAIPSVTVDQIFSKYMAALGGADAFQKVSSLTARGAMIQDRPARPFPAVALEISTKPGKQLVVAGGGQNATKTAYSGGSGWTGGGAEVRDLRRAELDGRRLEDVFNIASQLRELLVNPQVDHPAVVDGREVYVVSARTQALPMAKLYFDKDSGMLVRLVYHTDSIFGPYPTQIDYSDFRDVNGRKVPYTWVIAQTRNRKFTYVMQNVQAAAVDDAQFAKPAGR